MICLRCKGYGMVKVRERVLWCPNCEGMGREREHYFFQECLPIVGGDVSPTTSRLRASRPATCK